MASIKHRLDSNAPGDFYVDSTCIDCGTCRWVAPDSFEDADGSSRVYRQPKTETQQHRALMAVLACPTASIGTTEHHDMRAAQASFPDPLDDGVLHCGYHSADSYGAASYLVLRPEGNLLVDSPRFTGPLVKRIEELGGISLMFLTHRDDVADHQKFRDHFGCERIMHKDDIGSGTRGVERQVTGREPIGIADDLVLIPTPGHTRGSACLLHNDKHLFTGDHLAWEPEDKNLVIWRDVCWYDWDEQKKSVARLAPYKFEWVLPGHGRGVHLTKAAMNAKIRALLAELGEPVPA